MATDIRQTPSATIKMFERLKEILVEVAIDGTITNLESTQVRDRFDAYYAVCNDRLLGNIPLAIDSNRSWVFQGRPTKSSTGEQQPNFIGTMDSNSTITSRKPTTIRTADLSCNLDTQYNQVKKLRSNHSIASGSPEDFLLTGANVFQTIGFQMRDLLFVLSAEQMLKLHEFLKTVDLSQFSSAGMSTAGGLGIPVEHIEVFLTRKGILGQPPERTSIKFSDFKNE